jgi:hypothetical protein
VKACAAGLPDGVFQTKNQDLGIVLRALLWKMLVYFMDICSVLWPFGTFCDNLAYFYPFWYVVQSM